MLKKRFMNNSWIIKNRKSLSTIISTLIIILLVLVAAGIIWVVVKSLIQERAEWLEFGRFTLDLEIKAAQIENGDVTVVVVRRNPGQGNYIGMNFVFSDGTNSEIIKENYTLQELEERSFIFTLTEISTNNLTTISVAPIFELSSGKEAVGDIADSLEVTEEMKAGITGYAVSNFEMLGYSGAGKMEYGPFSSNTPKLPEFKKAIVNPLDVLPEDNQTFTAHVYSPYSVISVTSVTELDNSILNLDLEKIGEYVENNETIEIWSANWTVNDVHAITYRTTITATDSEGNENSITLTWTDSCQSAIGAHGANRIISQNCNTGTNINGLDGGNLTIADGITVIIDSGGKLVFNSGKSITPTGTITVNGEIKKAYLFYTDVDEDNYALNTVMTYSTSSSLPNKIRTSSGSLLGTSDCNDGNSGDWRNRYTDSDGDGHCPSSGQTCVGNDAGYVDSCTSYTDCCDTEANAYTGQTTYFTTPRTTCGGYDYSCASGEEQQWTTTGGSCVQCERSNGPVTKSPGTIINDDVIGNRPWMYLDDAYTSNNEYARRAGLADGGMSWILKATNFNMGVPSGATIDGIKVEIERDALGYPGVWDNLVRLVDHTGNYVGNNKAKSAAWSKTESYISFGGSTNKWGETWTRAIINDVDFGVGLSVILDPADGGDPHTALVDHIRITVYYTGICEESSGSLEWTGSAPACGVSGNYYTNSGTCDPQVCTDEGCVYESRTQACR